MMRNRGEFGALWLAVGLCAGCAQPPAAEPKKLDPALASHVLDGVPSDIQHPALIDFDSKVELVGYDIDPDSPAPAGSHVKLKMYWRSKTKLGPGWSLFTHVLDARGGQVMNLDDAGPLRQRSGDAPQALGPSDWEVGKIYVDEQDVELPRALQTPEVTVTVGVWRTFKVRVGKLDGGTKPVTEDRGSRLNVLSGPSDGKNRGIVAHIKTGWVPPPEPSPAAAGSAAPKT